MSSPDQTANAVRSERGSWLEPLVRRFLARINVGDLTIELPSGARLAHKGARPGPQAFLTVHRWRAIWRLILEGDVGFAESYISGDWSSRDLPAFIELAARNIEPLEAKINGSFADASDRPLASSRARQYTYRQPQKHRVSLRSRQCLLPMLARPEHDLFVRPLCGTFRYPRRCASQENQAHRGTSGHWG